MMQSKTVWMTATIATFSLTISACAPIQSGGYSRHPFTGKPIVNLKALEEREERRKEEKRSQEYRIYHNGEVIRVRVIGNSMHIYD